MQIDKILVADRIFIKYPVTVLLILLSVSQVKAQFSNGFEAGGYFQGMPIRISADLPELFGDQTFWEYRLQNRLNLNWYVTSSVTFNAEMRTRFFAGDLVEEIPGYADAIDMDRGLLNLSLLITEQDSYFIHYMPDRLNVDWSTEDWRVTVGRQRINWGVNTVSNPNDLFNIYSFYDFDYPERPGSDAIRIQHFLGWASRVEVAVSPARDLEQSVAAAMYVFNTRGYDIQIIGGYYRNRLAVGGGWAGSIRQSGFKGEVMLFTDLEDREDGLRTNVVVGISADHLFDNSLFLIAEGLYNQVGGRDQFVLLGEELSADNPSFSRFQFTVQGSYPFSPIFSGSLAAIYYPDEEAVFLAPSFTLSVLQDLDLNVFTRIFAGSGDSVFSSAGNVMGASLKWNF